MHDVQWCHTLHVLELRVCNAAVSSVTCMEIKAVIHRTGLMHFRDGHTQARFAWWPKQHPLKQVLQACSYMRSLEAPITAPLDAAVRQRTQCTLQPDHNLCQQRQEQAK